MVDLVSEILEAFPDARIHSGYARIRCPYHKDGKEHKPSMGILLEDRDNAPKGLCHCFACGKKVMLDQLFKDIGLKTTFDPLKSTLPNAEKVELITTTPLNKIQLPFRFSPYLESRGIGKAVQERFKIYERDGIVHMPVFDRNGNYLYDNSRSTSGKRFGVEGGANKSLWGIEEIDFSKLIVVCESQIDAMSFWEIGVQAVATLGADNIKSLTAIKSATNIFILAFDPDEAGIRARASASELLGKFRCRFLDLPQGIDVNQALQDIQDKRKFSNYMQEIVREFVQ